VKILIIGHAGFSESYGGGQVYVRNLIKGFLDKGYAIEYLNLAFTNTTYPKLNQQKVNGVLTQQLVLPDLWQNIGAGQNEEVLETLASALQDIAPDIIHAHAWKDITALAARKAGIPCVVTAHHGGIVCPAGALLNADDAICQVPACDTYCLKCCTKSVPGWRFWYPLLTAIPLKPRIWAGDRLRRLPFILFLTPLGTISVNVRDKMQSVHNIGKNSDRIIAPSSAIAEALVRNGVPEKKIAVITHGISLPQPQPLRADLGTGSMRFLYVGRISHVKGVHIMLEAFTGIPSLTYELHIVGGAITKQERRYLLKLKRKFALVNAVWHGSLPHEEIPQHIAACDVMVHPTISLEVFGLTIAEALAVGRPIIATRCGGAEVQIRDGENGLMVPPNNVMALRDAIQSIIDAPARLQSMAKQTGDVVSIVQHVEKLEKIYIELVDNVAPKKLIN
jgi:glycosyltransferase involved in cell wall biosynthesis